MTGVLNHQIVAADLASAVGLGKGLAGNAIPEGVDVAILQAETAGLRVTTDGVTTPTSAIGIPVPVGGVYRFAGAELKTAKVIRTASNSIANIIFGKSDGVGGTDLPFKGAAGGSSGPSAANPTGTVGLATVNGSADTFLRSDGAPPLSQSITPTWTGAHVFSTTVSGPTAAPGTNTTQLASTAFVTAAVAAGGVVSSVFGRTGAVTAQAGDYAVANVTGAAPLASPTFTGTPAGPTAAPGTNTTQLSTTAFVTAAVTAGGTTPGGSTRQVQFNNSAAFGGATGFEYQSGASPNVLVQAQNAAHVPAILRTAASHTANAFEVQTNLAASLFYVDKFGGLNTAAGVLSTLGNVTVAGVLTANAREVQSAVIGGVAYLINSAGSNYGTVQNDAADTWSLGYKTGTGTTLGTAVVTWNSSGATKFKSNVTLGTAAVGTSGVAVLSLPNATAGGTAPTTAPADSAQLFAADYAAGDCRFRVWTETGGGLWVGANTLEAVAPASGAGNSLTLRASAAASGNTNGGDVVVQLVAKSGSGADGGFIVRKAAGTPGTDEIQFSVSGSVPVIEAKNSQTFFILSNSAASGTNIAFEFRQSGNNRFDIANDRVSVGSGQMYSFSSTASSGGAADCGIARIAPGVMGAFTTAAGTGASWLQHTAGRARVTADVTNATATMANLTDLTITLIAGRKYVGYVTLFANDSTAAEGLAFDLNGGTATVTSLQAGFSAQPPGVTLGTLTGTTLDTDLTATTATTADATYVIDFAFVCNAGGTFIPRFSQVTHTLGTATVRRNSYLLIEDCPN